MQVVAIQKISLTEQIMKQLVDQIHSGQLKPGERLPGERDLAEALGVTRNSVREAIRTLSFLGILSIRPGSGNFVNENMLEIPFDTLSLLYLKEVEKFDEVYAARRLIETEVYLECYNHLEPAILSGIRERYNAILQYNKTVTDFSVERYCNLLDAIDLYVGQNCNNAIYYKFMQTIVALRRECALKTSHLPESRQRGLKDRKRIIDAMSEPNNRDKVVSALKHFFDRAFFTTNGNK